MKPFLQYALIFKNKVDNNINTYFLVRCTEFSMIECKIFKYSTCLFAINPMTNRFLEFSKTVLVWEGTMRTT